MNTLPLVSEIFSRLHYQGIELGFGMKYYPAPLVGMVLHNLHDIRPDRFVPLHIICRGIGGRPVTDSQWENHFTIWLPTDTDNPDFVTDFNCIKAIADDNKILIWQPNDWQKPHILIARYVAAMVIGRAVSFGPREILLDYYSSDARKKWGMMIDRAICENGGPLMEIYSTALGCEPCVFRSLDVLKTVSVDSRPAHNETFETRIPYGKNIIGIDIGGTSVRIDRFVSTTEAFALGLPDNHQVIDKINTQEIVKYRQDHKIEHWGAKDFINFLQILLQKPIIDDKTIAIGISLAAPVSESVGVPLAPSGPLKKHFGLSWDIVTFQPASFHSLDFSNVWFNTVVKVLNDGEADIKDTDQSIPNQYHEGVTVELKAGTGIAVAVHRDGTTWNVKAETAKAVLNLIVEPQNKDCKERFQEGCMGTYCSKNGLGSLTKDVLFYHDDGDYYENPGEFIGFILNDILGFPQIFDARRKKFENTKTRVKQTNIKKNVFIERLKGFIGESKELDILLNRSRIIYQLRKDVEHESLIDCQGRQLLDFLQYNTKLITSSWDNKPTSEFQASDFTSLSELQKFSIGCAWVLGRWLADAIALVVEIYGANEIRLAGGPLSQATGIFVTASVEKTLADRYGFNLDVVWDKCQYRVGKRGMFSTSPHRIRSMKSLRLYYPQGESSDVSGPRGAAKAALEAWIVHVKQDQLAQCRDWVQVRPKLDTFSPETVLEKNGLYKPNNGVFEKCEKDKKDQPVLITTEEVADMLARESAALGLTRTVQLDFMKYH